MNFQFSKFASSANSRASPVGSKDICFRLNFQTENNVGFTLLETIVALAVILAAVVGPITLITRSIFNFSFAKNKLIANNLAQEGLELMRLVRDNNVLCDSLNGPPVWRWNRNPDDSENLTDTEREADASETHAISCGSATLHSPKLNQFAGTALKYDNNPSSPTFGLYNYVTGDATPFVRSISILVPPKSPVPDFDITPPTEQMDVIVRVEWLERGISGDFTQCKTLGSRCVILRERLYNWR